MANLSYTQIVFGGTNPTMTAADVAGDNIPVNDRGFLVVTNGSGASINVTLQTPGNTQWGLAQPDVVIAVPAAATRYIGPMQAALMDPTDKAVKVSYSAVASVTRSALFI